MKVGFIGSGAMGGALMKSIREKNPMLSLCVYDKDGQKMTDAAQQYQAETAIDAAAVTAASDIVFLAVKPQHMSSVLEVCYPALKHEPVFVTLAVGIPLSAYTNVLGKSAKVVRTMPNTPALIGEGITFYCCSDNVGSSEEGQVVSLLESVGMVEKMDEKSLPLVTALTGSSPAYFFMMIEAMADAAVLSGLPRAESIRWAAAAMAGSARLVMESGKHPGQLKDMVTSPGGTTIEGVAVLERKGFRSAIMDAMNAVTAKTFAIADKEKQVT